MARKWRKSFHDVEFLPLLSNDVPPNQCALLTWNDINTASTYRYIQNIFVSLCHGKNGF